MTREGMCTLCPLSFCVIENLPEKSPEGIKVRLAPVTIHLTHKLMAPTLRPLSVSLFLSVLLYHSFLFFSVLFTHFSIFTPLRKVL